MIVTLIRVQFNPKSRAVEMEEAIKLAKKSGAVFEEKMCTVNFDKGEDPDLRRLLRLIRGLKGTVLYIDEQQHEIQPILNILECWHTCNGVCKRGIDHLWISGLHLRRPFPHLGEDLIQVISRLLQSQNEVLDVKDEIDEEAEPEENEDSEVSTELEDDEHETEIDEEDENEEWYGDFDWRLMFYPEYVEKIAETESPEGMIETKFTMTRKDLIEDFFESTILEAQLCPKYNRKKTEESFNRYPEQLNLKRIIKIRDRKYPYPL